MTDGEECHATVQVEEADEVVYKDIDVRHACRASRRPVHEAPTTVLYGHTGMSKRERTGLR